MADSYVCSGAMMRCTMGTSPAQLTVLPVRTVFLTGQPQANISDHKSMVNLAPFGLCRSLGFPATASATAAALGTLTPMPCVHNTPAPWMGGKMDDLIKGQPALLKSSKCQCMWGGTISLITDGQVGEGTQYVQKKQQEDFEFQQENNSGLNQDSVLDGIQLALDAAGFAPGVGAIPDLINASISALRGNWAEAGLSVLAAVPLIGDVAAGAKMAKRGMKIAKMAKKSVNRNVDLSIKSLVKRGMSVEDAKAFRRGVRNERKNVAKKFYQDYGGFKGKNIDQQIEAHLQGIDFNKPIKVDKLPPAGQKDVVLYQYRNLSVNTGEYDIPGKYYSINPKTTPGELGIADYGVAINDNVTGVAKGQLPLPFSNIPKKQVSVTVVNEVPCLRSTARSITDTWSVPGKSFTTKGGGEQLFVPSLKPIK